MQANPPDEVWFAVFLSLSYFDLLCVSRVCKLWRKIVQCYPKLALKLFKTTLSCIDGPNPLQFHPATEKISYTLGAPSSSIAFSTSSSYHRGLDLRPLTDFSIANDFASIPAARRICLKFFRKCECCCAVPPLYVTMFNECGVRLTDIFSAIAEEMSSPCDVLHYLSRGAFSARLYRGQTAARNIKADIFGRHKRYQGIWCDVQDDAKVTIARLHRSVLRVLEERNRHTMSRDASKGSVEELKTCMLVDM